MDPESLFLLNCSCVDFVPINFTWLFILCDRYINVSEIGHKSNETAAVMILTSQISSLTDF